MKVNKTLRAHAKAYGHRLVTMSCQTPKGSEMSLELCVTAKDAAKICKMFYKIVELSRKAHAEGEDE